MGQLAVWHVINMQCCRLAVDMVDYEQNVQYHSFIARKLIDLNNWKQAIIVRPIIPTTGEENVQDYNFSNLKGRTKR